MEPVIHSADTPRLATVDDKLEITASVSPFSFERGNQPELGALIVEAINLMGGAGPCAEENYQRAVDRLARNAGAVVVLLAEEYERLDASQYLDRWALVHLMVELRHDAALDFVDRLLSRKLPEERGVDLHSFSTLAEEVMIRTTAVDVLTGLAHDGSSRAVELMLRHVGHENFSVRRAAVQGYLEHGGEGARETLLKHLPERDQHLIDIKRVDVRTVPQAEGGRFLVCRDSRDDLPSHDLGVADGSNDNKAKSGCPHCD
ncbi:MAG: hypothetical protein ABIT04_04700 [Novosphingobium sp.]